MISALVMILGLGFSGLGPFMGSTRTFSEIFLAAVATPHHLHVSTDLLMH